MKKMFLLCSTLIWLVHLNVMDRCKCWSDNIAFLDHEAKLSKLLFNKLLANRSTAEKGQHQQAEIGDIMTYYSRVSHFLVNTLIPQG